jgi:2-polyprenyl-3-methyl-5-hydroxy-6-metoxy-1,4-benzoquinol methylase
VAKEYEGKMGNQLKSVKFDEAYYREHKEAGLDYLAFGPWQQQYGRWFVECFGLKGKRVLDLGCACGSILRGLGEAGAFACGVDVSEHMVRLAVEAHPHLSAVMRVGDAAELGELYGPQTFDAIHCAQVAEHWKPEKVVTILRECRRVLRPGGLFFVCLDTTEMYERQGRKLENEDPTHWCVRPVKWWQDLFHTQGFEDETEQWKEILEKHPESMSARYDWDYFVVRRRA